VHGGGGSSASPANRQALKSLISKISNVPPMSNSAMLSAIGPSGEQALNDFLSRKSGQTQDSLGDAIDEEDDDKDASEDSDDKESDDDDEELRPLDAARLLKRRDRESSGSESPAVKKGKVVSGRLSSEEENFSKSFLYVKVPYPIFWSEDSVNERNLGSYREVLLRPSSIEYQRVRNAFQTGLYAGIGTTRKIYRIEYPMRLTIFQLELAAMKERKGEGVPTRVQSLYHSSKNPYNYHSILKNNFSLKYAEKSALGQGVYFAESPLYSNQHLYSSPLNPDFDNINVDANVGQLQEELGQTKIMLVCRVILGDVLYLPQKTRDTEDMTAPVPGYDSHGYREDINDHIFCVFTNKRILPEYVIYYDVRRDQPIDDVASMQSMDNLDETGREFPLQERTWDTDLYDTHHNDRELVIALENTPKTKAYDYSDQKMYSDYELEVTDRQKS